MSLEDLEKQLYAFRKEKEQEGNTGDISATSLRPEKEKENHQDISGSWKNEDIEDLKKSGEKKSRFKKIFFISGAMIMLASAIIGGGLFFLKQISTPKDVTIEIYAPNEVNRGVPFEVTVQVTNEISSFLEDAKITLSLGKGFVSLDATNSANRSMASESIGNLGGGSLTKRSFKILSVGDLNSSQKVTAELSYRAGGRATFQTKTTKDISITSSAIKVDVSTPEQILAGSKFDLEVAYTNVSNFDFPDVVLEAKYPASFAFDSSSISPSSLDNYWRLGELRAGSKGSIQIKGSLNVGVRESANIPFSAGVSFFGKDYVIDEKLATLSVSPSPVSLEIVTNGKDDYVAKMGDQVTYVIKYTNNSGIALADVVLKTQFVGELFDFKSLQTNGSFDSMTGTVTWTASRVPAFRLLEPGASGQVEVRVKLDPYYEIKRPSDKNFILKAVAEIDSPSVPYYMTANKTSASVSKETKVMGVMSVDAKGFYRDAESGIINTGPFPPQVNRKTQFSIHWVIKNYITDMSNIEVKTSLSGGVEWVGLVSSNIDEKPEYNERTKEVVWNIDKILATKGVLGEPVEAVFKVEVTPNIAETGQFKEIIGRTSISGTDDFTGTQVMGYDSAITTTLPDDRTIGTNEGRIAP